MATSHGLPLLDIQPDHLARLAVAVAAARSSIESSLDVYGSHLGSLRLASRTGNIRTHREPFSGLEIDREGPEVAERWSFSAGADATTTV